MNFDKYKDHFTVTGQDSEEFGDYVNKTAKMLGKPFFVVFKMVEKWSLTKIKQRYYECERLEGKWKRIMWFSKRKKDRA